MIWKIITGIYDADFNRLLISPELVYKSIEDAQGDLGFLTYSQGKIAAFTTMRTIGTLGMVDVPLNILSTVVFPPFTGGLGVISGIKYLIDREQWGVIVKGTVLDRILSRGVMNIIKNETGLGLVGNDGLYKFLEVVDKIDGLKEYDKERHPLDKYLFSLIGKLEVGIFKSLGFKASKPMQYLVVKDGKVTNNLLIPGRKLAGWQVDKLYAMWMGGINRSRGAQEISVFVVSKVDLSEILALGGAKEKYISFFNSSSGKEILDKALRTAAEKGVTINSDNQFSYSEYQVLEIDGKQYRLKVTHEVTLNPGVRMAEESLELAQELNRNAPKITQAMEYGGLLRRDTHKKTEVYVGKEALEGGKNTLAKLLKGNSPDKLEYNRRSVSFRNPETKEKLTLMCGQEKARENSRHKAQELRVAGELENLRTVGGALYLDFKTGKPLAFKGRAALSDELSKIQELPVLLAKRIENAKSGNEENGNKYVYETTITIDGKEKKVIAILFFSLKDAQNLVKKAEIDLGVTKWQMNNLERLHKRTSEDIALAHTRNAPMTYIKNSNTYERLALPKELQIPQEAFDKDEARFWVANMDIYGNTYWLVTDLVSGKQVIEVISLNGAKVLTKEYDQEIEKILATYWNTIRKETKEFNADEYRKQGDVAYAARDNGDTVKVMENTVALAAHQVKALPGVSVKLMAPQKIETTTHWIGYNGEKQTKEALSGDNVVLDKYTYFNVEDAKGKTIKINDALYHVPAIGQYAIKITQGIGSEGRYTGKGTAEIVKINGDKEENILVAEESNFLGYVNGLDIEVERNDQLNKILINGSAKNIGCIEIKTSTNQIENKTHIYINDNGDSVYLSSKNQYVYLGYRCLGR